MNEPVTVRGARGIPTPVDLVRFGFRLAGMQLTMARELMLVPARVLALVETVEEIVGRVQMLLDEASRAVQAVDGVIVVAAHTVDEARTIVRGAGEVVRRADQTVSGADHVVARVQRTVDSADHVVARVGRTVDSADHVVARVDSTVDSADLVVAHVETTVSAADLLVGRAMPLLDFAEDTVDGFRPIVQALLVAADLDPERARQVATRLVEVLAWADSVVTRLAPLADRVLDSVDPEEIDAVVALIDHLPELTDSLEKDILPVLSTLDTVAPEVHEILTVAQECLEAISGIPGFKLLRRRGEERQNDERGSASTGAGRD